MRTKRLSALAVACVVLVTGAVATPAWAESNAVMSWGMNTFGQLGNELPGLLPGEVFGLSKVSAISAGNDHALALREGKVMGWGSNSAGQSGAENTEKCTSGICRTPVEVGGLSGVTAVAAGGGHSLALIEGEVWSWGSNANGQLGRSTGTETSSRSPAPVELTEKAVAIAAGQEEGFAVMQNHTVMAWGDNRYGQLGTGNTESRNGKPMLVVRANGETLTEVAAIRAGVGGAIALLKNGTVVTWGDNYFGDLGIGTFEGPEVCPGVNPRNVACSRRALPVSGLQEVTAVSAALGGATDAVLLKNQTVMTWGYNHWGQLGNGKSGIDNGGEAANSDIPVHVKGLPNSVVSIASEAYVTMALLSTGKLMTWGDDEQGELGDGRAGRTPPVYSELPVEVLSEVTAMAGASHYGLAIQRRP